MPATSPQAIERRNRLERAKMRAYRRDYPEKATATLRACYWRKRVRKLQAQLAAAQENATRWERRVEAMRWRDA